MISSFKQNKTLFITQSAIIAALYVLLTFISNIAGFSSGPIQLRIGEALTILPVFTPAAIPGLFVGCLLANILTGCALWDIIFGSLITFIAAICTYALKQYKIMKYLPPVLANTLCLPFILSLVYHFEGSIWYFMLTIFIGETLSCGLLGALLFKLIQKNIRHIPFL